jgi:hypothetical protein
VGAVVSSGAEFVWTLIEHADSPLLEAELAEALRYELSPRPMTARQRRRTDLWLLRDLIVAADGAFFPERIVYDGARGSIGALSGHTLVCRYGSWWEACSIAARMEADGKLPRGRTFSGGRLTRGRPAPKPYTTEEAVSAARLCAFSLGRRPTSQDYYDWSERQRRIARERRIERRVPSKMALARLFPGPRRWQRIGAAAAITDRELQQARAALLRLTGNDPSEPFLALPLGEAARLAAELGGSLDWLAGRTAHTSPIADPRLRFSPARFRMLRERSPVVPGHLAAAAGLTIGQSRRLLAGTFEPTLETVVALASLLGVAAADLCECSADDKWLTAITRREKPV